MMGWNRHISRFLIFLFLIPAVAFSEKIPEYDREEWGRWERTGEYGPRGCAWDTRHYLLMTIGKKWAPDFVTVSGERGKACRVRSFKMVDPYTGEPYVGPAGKKVHIDHIVAISEAHRSGGWAWSEEMKNRFYNDPENLVPTLASVNISKGGKDVGIEGGGPWWPPDEGKKCWFANRVIHVKWKWGLDIDEEERRSLMRALRNCEDLPPMTRAFLLNWAFETDDKIRTIELRIQALEDMQPRRKRQ